MAVNPYKTKAFVYYGPGQIRLEELEIDCGPEDILVKVLASARCGTDKTIFYKGHPKVKPPAILGHELCCEIVEVGARVGKLTTGIGYRDGKKIRCAFRVGERVTVQSRIARYHNGLMLIRDPITILSFILPAGYSQYMKISRELILSGSIIRVPEGVTDEEAALIEPAACALESVFSTPHPVRADREGRHVFRAGIRPGGQACVIGSGTVSMIYAQLCRLEGAARVIMLVRSKGKQQLVRQLLGDGVKTLITEDYGKLPLPERMKAEEAIIARLKEMTAGYLFDDVIAACPSPDAQRLMLKLYTPEGYAVGACFAGTHELVDGADIDRNHYHCAKTIGTTGCSTRAMEMIAQWLGERKLSFRGLTDPRRFTLRDRPEEFFVFTGLKPVLYPWQ